MKGPSFCLYTKELDDVLGISLPRTSSDQDSKYKQYNELTIMYQSNCFPLDTCQLFFYLDTVTLDEEVSNSSSAEEPSAGDAISKSCYEVTPPDRH